MDSTVSSVVRIPAVSTNLKATPSMFISSSMVSRVVPAMSDTIALSSFRSAFRRVDLPTFGSPTIATGIPFLITFPRANESIRRFKTSEILSINFSNSLRSANATSSSAKSNSSSIKDAKFNNSCRSPCNSLANPPRICCMAI